MIKFETVLNEKELELLQLALAEYQMKMDAGAELVPASIKKEYRNAAAACDDLFYKLMHLSPYGVEVEQYEV